MGKLKLKSHYTAKELSGFKIESLPKHHSNVRAKAKRENWQSRPRMGKGGGVEYAFSSLPIEAQAEIKALALKTLTKTAPSSERSIVLAERDIGTLTARQREIADARLQMVAYVNQLEANVSRTVALKITSEQSQAGELPGELNAVCALALARQRKKRGVGQRILHQWCIDAALCDSPAERLNALAPIALGRTAVPVTALEWLPDFLAVYRQKNGVNISEAYRHFARAWAVGGGSLEDLPSIDSVRAAMNKLPGWVRECGRLTGAALRAKKTYVKRDWSQMQPNDVWMGDGHSMKLKVQHPDHGQPFTPELTLIIDTATRFVVGWSLSYSENQIAVADALRHGVSRHGIPAIYYSDNGGGQANKTFDADVTGILPRLGVHHETGIPGNPQGRGMIERLNKTLAHYIARQFPTYYGPGADPDTVREVLTGTQSLQKATLEGKRDLTPKQTRALGKLPRWDDVLSVIEQAVHDYNFNHKHRSLGNVTPAAMRQHLLDEMDANDLILLTEPEARDLFRPQFTRTVQRGWLQLHNKYYWHRELENHDNKAVIVSVDQHNPSTVIVRDIDGLWLCDGVLDGNKKAGFALSLVEEKRQERAKRAIKRLNEKKARVMRELSPALDAPDASFSDLLRAEPAPKPKQWAVLETELQQTGE